MNILLVKMTSMGDVIHTLPAITDAMRARPNLHFDWVIDKAFVEVANWHPGVNRIIKSAHRHWRKRFLQAATRAQISQFWRELRAQRYDLIIDGQSNFKSALISCFAHGVRCGYDRHSAREYIAHWAYQRKYSVSKQEHAVTRLRSLFAQALDYPLPQTVPDFGIDRSRFKQPNIALPEKYVLFVPNASWITKLWPETYWKELIERATLAGLTILLPAGNAEEAARTARLSANHPQVQALPFMSLAEIAYITARASAAVAVDTGLGHLAAALQVPAVTLYGASDHALVGVHGEKQIHLQAKFPCAPCFQKHCTWREPSQQQPACFTKLPPTHVWETLQKIM